MSGKLGNKSLLSLTFFTEGKKRSKEREDEICLKEKRKGRKSFFFQHVRNAVFYLFVYAALLSSGSLCSERRKYCLYEVEK